MKRELRRRVQWVSIILAVMFVAVVAACGGASSNSEGVDEPSPSRRDRGTAQDPSICPYDCFLNEGRCYMVPTEDPEEMRGDEVPVLEPEPCDPRCCEAE